MNRSDGQPLTAAEVHLKQLQRDALVAEAEDLARGIRHLSVATGDLETDEDVARVAQLTSVAWQGREGAHMRASRGGNDYITLVIEGPAAEQVVDDLAALAEDLNPGFWRISLSQNPF